MRAVALPMLVLAVSFPVLGLGLGLGLVAGSSSPSGAAPTESPAPTSPVSSEPAPGDGSAPGAVVPVADAGAGTDGDAAAGTASTYRSSLSICWTDATCPRAMIVAHGGDWSATTVPYGSMGAVIAAYDHGVDAVKLDVRVTKDNVPVISHSSPIEIYESLDCYNQRIEDMTAAQVTGCHFVQKASESFQRLDTVLSYLRGKMVVQLTVKLPADYARTISEVNALSAQDFAFLEVSTAELQTVLPPIPGSNQIYWLVNVGSTLSDIDVLLDTVKNPRAFMVEMDPSAQTSTLVTTRLHPAKVRAFTYDSSATASVAELQAFFDQGFDVVSANTTPNNEAARVAVNTARGVTPP